MSGPVGTAGVDNEARILAGANRLEMMINNGWTIHHMTDGFFDVFEDNSGVDLVNSLNETVGLGSVYGGPSSYVSIDSADVIESGFNYNGDNGTTAFDGSTTTETLSTSINTSAIGAFLACDMGEQKFINRIYVYFPSAASAPTSAIIITSDDGITWINDTTFTPNAGGYSAVIPNNRFARYYGVKVNGGRVDNTPYPVTIGEIMPRAYTDGFDYRSLVITASDIPSKARFLALYSCDYSFQLNTDVEAYASSDGGATFDKITLEDGGMIYSDGGEVVHLLYGEVALTGGSDQMVARFKTGPQIDALQGAWLQWQ